MEKLSILEYLTHMLNGTLTPEMATHMQYPTPISQTLGIKLSEIDEGRATVRMETSKELHSNQQGTIHGGLICELADAAIGTAHSTLINEGESFTSIELKINFYRPVFGSVLSAKAKPLQKGKNISHYLCEVIREDGKIAALVTSTVMTLRGEKAIGR